ncbi:MAG: EF-P 5-aminopentanol modification-associated protein YfmF, partial [Acutalibacteraceae bacterium]
SLLSMLLTGATVDYPDYTSLNAALNELYGASLYSDVVKFGDMRIIKFVISFLDDRFALYKEKISEKAVLLLLSAIFNPPLENGRFKEKEFENNKRILIEQIDGEINDKRIYALTNTEKVMYENEPAGISRYGSCETVKSLTNEQVVNAHKKLLKEAFVRVNVVSQSESSANTIFDKITEYFSSLDRNVEKKNMTAVHKTTGEIKKQDEQMNVTQGKLCMGFTLDVGKKREENIKSMIFVDMFGGGPYSKLFLNVREKQSLCYYCAARFNSRKATFTVDSGVLNENREKAYNGILEQLEEMKKGNFTDEDLMASKMAVSDSLAKISDLASNIDNWYALRTFDEGETPEKTVEVINSVTREDIIRIADSVKLDTVYYLGPIKGENA